MSSSTATRAERGSLRQLIVGTRRMAEELVERFAGAADRGSAFTLALSALRASCSGMALLRSGRFVVRNRAWTALDHRAGGEWRVEGSLHPTLHALALAEARRAGEGDEDVRELRAERTSPEQVLAIRIERLRRPGAPVFLLMARDLTERLRAERELARARDLFAEQERVRAVGQLASGVAHDLNNVLHAMALRVEVLRHEASSPERREASLDALSRMVNDAAQRVTRLQDVALRRQGAPPAQVDLVAVVRDAAASLAPDGGEARTASGAAVRIDVALDQLPPVRGNAAELRDVLVSLLVNARDAMSAGGTIHVEGERRGAFAVVRLRDEGPGIAPAALPRLFDPFFTTKGEKGTGLGLAIARSVVLRLGGRIRAWNAEGGGAVFELELPVSPAQARPTPPPGAAHPTPARVLVVDDDSDILEAARLVLEDLGHRVETAPSGTAALDRIAAGASYDVVICDIGMPVLDGWAVAERLRMILPDARVYLVTGWAHEIPLDEPRRRLVEGILPKPLPLDALQALFTSVTPVASGPLAAQPL